MICFINIFAYIISLYFKFKYDIESKFSKVKFNLKISDNTNQFFIIIEALINLINFKLILEFLNNSIILIKFINFKIKQ